MCHSLDQLFFWRPACCIDLLNSLVALIDYCYDQKAGSERWQ